MSTVLPCPFCGCTDTLLGEILSSDADGRNHATQAECNDCGAVGPRAPLASGEIDYGAEKSRAAWNRRVVTP